MRKWLLPLLLTVLLCGCTKEPEETVPPTTGNPGQTLAQGLTAWPVDTQEPTTVSHLGAHLLLVSTGKSQTQLRLASPNDGQILLEVSLNGSLSLENGGIQLLEDGVAYYSESTGELVVLNANLRQMHRLKLPQDYVQIPRLSSQGTVLFYTTKDQIRALELRTGVDRLVLQTEADVPRINQVLMNGDLLRCVGEKEKTMILCANTGRILLEGIGAQSLEVVGKSYFLQMKEGAVPELIFATGREAPRSLWGLAEDVTLFGFPETEQLLTLKAESLLECYDLTTGCRTAALTLPTGLQLTQLAVTEDKTFWFFSGGNLCHWDPVQSPAGENGTYLEHHFSQTQPDLEGLEELRQYVQELGEQYGVEILMGPEAAEGVEDYILTQEHLTQVYKKYLPAVEAALSRFPEGFLQKTLESTGGKLSIGLVRSIQGIAQKGTLDRPQGLQFWQGKDACVKVVLGEELEAGLAHQIMHVIDSRVLSFSGVYDQWGDLNPKDFQYDNSYIANLNRQDTQHLEGETAAFVDLFSMSFAREDRARIFEKACLPGNEDLFRAPVLQKKLQLLCKGIRQAFDLTQTEEALLWEQYLLETE